MKTYKLKIKITSSLGTPPAADTIWGHICWAIRYRESAAALEQFLCDYDSDNLPLLISDPFPTGFMPVPILPNFRADTDKEIAFDKIKKISKSNLITADFFNPRQKISKIMAIKHINDSRIESVPNIMEKATVAHNTINRLTGAVLQPQAEDDPSGLFFTEEYHIDTKNPPVMDIYVLSRYSPERILQLFEWAFETGYGKYASRGKGRIELCGIDEYSLPHSDNPNAIMLLASCLPAQTDPIEGYWQLFTRYGKLGGHFANGPMKDLGVDENLPFKKPVTMLKAGSVLKTSEPKHYYGQVARGVHTVEQIRHYGIAPALTINCDFGGEK